MATLGNIRKHSTLLLIVIGGALAAFILTDLMSSAGGGRGPAFVGEVAGEEISIQIFEERVQKGIENYKNSNPNSTINQETLARIRDGIWDEYIKDHLMKAEFEELGIDVDSEELFELFQGNNVHSEISKIGLFQDSTTKQFDRSRMIQYMKSLESDQNAEAREQWLSFEDYISWLRKNEKYNRLVEQGIYVSSAEAQVSFNQGNENINFEYVSIPFTHIADSLVDVTDSEMENYYQNHIGEYQQEESRSVDYVVFTVIPSEKDDEDTRNNLEAITKTFEAYSDFEFFVKRNSDISNPIFNFVKEDGILDSNATSLFTAEKGTVLGPYLFSEGNYRLAKLADVQYRPDSVQARHILITPDENKDLDSINVLVESVKKEIESGKDFADLAQIHSVDKGSAIKGGDLGWFKEGAMVAEFNEVCFTANKGDLTIVQSEFGIHLIEVTKKSRNVKKVKIAFVDRIVEPSSEAHNSYYTQAAQFAGALLNTDTTNFEDLIISSNLAKRNENNVSPSKQNISGLENSRAMIKWMKDAQKDEISDVFEFGNNYVVATLTKVNEEGDIPLEDVKEEIRAKALKQKKGKMVFDEINSITYKTLSELATAMSRPVELAANVSFLNNQTGVYLMDWELIGLVCASENDVITKPIIGANAVFVAKVIKRNDPRTTGNFSQQQIQITNELKQNASTSAYNAIKENAGIVDNRNDFY